MSGVTVFLVPVLGVGLTGVVVVAGVVVALGGVTVGVVPGRTPPAFMAAGLALVVALLADGVAGVVPAAGATLPVDACVTVPPTAPHGFACLAG